MTQPNILFVYSDQHRADAMGCAGNELIHTPNLDRLANEGVRFSNAWTESPICQPARASLLTAKYPNEHGIIGNFTGECEPGWESYPRNLQMAGYSTAVIGKTHYSNWPMGKEKEPAPADAWIKGFGYDHVVEEFDRYVHIGYETPYTKYVKTRGDFEAYQQAVRDRFRIGDRHWEAVTSPLPQELDLTSFLADEASTWIAEQPASKPWFLNLAFVQPHVPLMGDPIWADYYKDMQIPRTETDAPDPGSERWSEHIQVLRKHSHSELLADDFVLAGARQYYAMISLIDQKVGEIMQTLDARGELDNTWIIYASDHGEMLGDHGLMAKMCFYKSSVRVPMIIRPPGGCKASISDAPVQAFDLVPTMLEIANANPLPEASAQSLLAKIAGHGGDDREVTHSMIRMRPGMPTWVAVSDGHYRLTYERDREEVVEFFDLGNDPNENDNLAEDASQLPRVSRLFNLSRDVLNSGS